MTLLLSINVKFESILLKIRHSGSAVFKLVLKPMGLVQCYIKQAVFGQKTESLRHTLSFVSGNFKISVTSYGLFWDLIDFKFGPLTTQFYDRLDYHCHGCP